MTRRFVARWLCLDLSAEAELVLLCARMQLDPGAKARALAIMDGAPHWPLVQWLVRINKLVPLFMHTMQGHFPGRMPAAVAQELDAELEQHRAGNRDTLALLGEIVDTFQREGIELIPFKGLVLAQMAYGSIELRQRGDIDLLVRPAQFLKARDLLVRQGFEGSYFGHAEVATVQAQLGRTDRRASADLHYGLTPQYQQANLAEATAGSRFDSDLRNLPVRDRTYWFCHLDPAPVWERRTSVRIDGRSFPALSAEDTVLVALINGIKENWRTLSRVCDLAELMRSCPELDWDMIADTVTRLGIRTKTLLAVRMACDFLGASAPAPFAEALARHDIGALALGIRRRMTGNPLLPGHEEHKRLVSLLTMDGLADVARYLRFVRAAPIGPNGSAALERGFPGFLCRIANQWLVSCAHRLGVPRLFASGETTRR